MAESRTTVLVGKIGPAFGGAAASAYGSVTYPMSETLTHERREHVLDMLFAVLADNASDGIEYACDAYIAPERVCTGDLLTII